jgi:hypothetical protein
MRIMAMDAEKVGSFATGKIALSLSMDSYLPIVEDIAVAFPTKDVAFIKTDEIAIEESQFISVCSIMAIETPPHGLCMV